MACHIVCFDSKTQQMIDLITGQPIAGLPKRDSGILHITNGKWKQIITLPRIILMGEVTNNEMIDRSIELEDAVSLPFGVGTYDKLKAMPIIGDINRLDGVSCKLICRLVDSCLVINDIQVPCFKTDTVDTSLIGTPGYGTPTPVIIYHDYYSATKIIPYQKCLELKEIETNFIVKSDGLPTGTFTFRDYDFSSRPPGYTLLYKPDKYLLISVVDGTIVRVTNQMPIVVLSGIITSVHPVVMIGRLVADPMTEVLKDLPLRWADATLGIHVNLKCRVFRGWLNVVG